jgi:hypothetical protein
MGLCHLCDVYEEKKRKKREEEERRRKEQLHQAIEKAETKRKATQQQRARNAKGQNQNPRSSAKHPPRSLTGNRQAAGAAQG